MLDAARATIAGLSLPAAIGDTEIKATSLNEWGIALGAATLALEAALETPSLFPTSGSAERAM